MHKKNESDLENFFKKTLSAQYGVEYEDNEMEGKEEFQFVIKQLANILWIK
ncbi:MAG: hypothetical protein IPG60_07595 [Bacteroidetes bacterium]|nr:hypothetical protein [Bacteroidota bacterium]